jgi:alkylation response protein AidB-like acyl-CoA dehydrogenase
MLLIPRLPGLKTRKIEIGAGGMAATTYVTFEDVKVPVEYLVGQEGLGFKYTMSNFNHERLFIAFQAVRCARTCLEDAMVWCQKRETFGKKLIEQPVVRHKFGHMARQVDALQAWMESIIYELDHLGLAKGISTVIAPDLGLCEIGSELLGGVTGLLKVQGGIVTKYVADECVKLMGGSVLAFREHITIWLTKISLGLTKTGQGARIEAISRGANTLIVPG